MFVANVNSLIYEISDFSTVFVNNGFCVMQQLFAKLKPHSVRCSFGEHSSHEQWQV